MTISYLFAILIFAENIFVPGGAGAVSVEGEAAGAGAPWCKYTRYISSISEELLFKFRDLIQFLSITWFFLYKKTIIVRLFFFLVSLTFHPFYVPVLNCNINITAYLLGFCLIEKNSIYLWLGNHHNNKLLLVNCIFGKGFIVDWIRNLISK